MANGWDNYKLDHIRRWKHSCLLSVISPLGGVCDLMKLSLQGWLKINFPLTRIKKKKEKKNNILAAGEVSELRVFLTLWKQPQGQDCK